MRAVNTDFQMELPARHSRASDWSLEDECNIVSTFYNAWYHAMTIAMIREVGHARTYEIHEAMLRHHQKDYFLPGLRKLGLDKERSDAIRCAKYHCYSNAIGGLRTRYAIESDDKAWLFYYPSASDNPWPAQGVVIHTQRNMTVDYLGWHGNNGTLLGNPGLVFCATHFIANGDPFDGGYFLDTHRDVPPASKVEVRTGEKLPRGLDFQSMQLNSDEWPPVRRAKAQRAYAVTWAADRVWTAVDGIGAPAVEIVAYALSTMLYAWLPRFWSAFATSSDARPLNQVADILNGLCSISGLGSRLAWDARGVTVDFDKPLADFVASGVSAEERRLMDAALRKAWAGFAQHFDADISLEAGSDRQWRFTLPD